MAAAFLLWPSVPSSSPDGSRLAAAEGAGGRGGIPLQLLGSDQKPDPPPVPISKPKARKACGKHPAPKRPPQRGLGVAQLERLRLQDRWNKIADQEIQPPCYSVFPVTCVAEGGWRDLPQASPTYCYVQRCRDLNTVLASSYGSVPAARSVLHDQYALDRIRISGLAASAPPVVEPPSNQMLQCLLCNCDFCARMKSLGATNIGLNALSGRDLLGANRGAFIPIQEVKSPERKIEYYEFFPHVEDASFGDSEFASRMNGDASSSEGSSVFLDLSLKLSR